jgi:uracil-DNA glycosylase family 4
VTTEERTAALEAIASEVSACQRCRLSETRTRSVPGEGSPDTEVVFVGEGPGSNEDKQGRPFVGAAGTLLQELLGLVGWSRDDVFITNVVKCRPPNNRDPEPDEIAACEPYLRRQLAVLDPAVLVTLGRFSLQTFMPGDRISRVHGTSRPVEPGTGARAATGYAMYHPAAALRQRSLKETMERDMAAIPEVLIRARAERTATDSVAVAPSTSPAPVPATASIPVANSERSRSEPPTPQTLPTPPAAAPQPAVPPTSAAPTDTQPQRQAAVAADTPEEPDTMKNPDDQLGLF